MTRIRLTLAYDGTDFAGWQVQPGAVSIQETLESALARIEEEPVRVTGAGRTDAGVHALAQVAHFDTGKDHPAETWVKALNANLPDDVVVRSARIVDKAFHARYSAGDKTYRYRILNRPVACPFRRRVVWHVPEPLDVAAMQKAATALVGEHDFTSFRAAGCGAKGPVRTIRCLSVETADDEVVFEVIGSGFLKQMVRNLVGTLVRVGRGKRPPAWPGEVLAAKDRTLAGETAPAKGLVMVRVTYPPPFDTA